MKTLTYKGFGMDNEGWVSFLIEINKRIAWTERPVMISIQSSDQKFNIDEQVDEDGFQRIHSESEIVGSALETNYGNYVHFEDVREKRLPEETWFNNGDLFLGYYGHSSIKEAVSWIKEIVAERREYWKTRKGEYNRLVAELRELTIEDFLDESTEDEITISQTVRRRR